MFAHGVTYLLPVNEAVTSNSCSPWARWQEALWTHQAHPSPCTTQAWQSLSAAHTPGHGELCRLLVHVLPCPRPTQRPCGHQPHTGLAVHEDWVLWRAHMAPLVAGRLAGATMVSGRV